MNKSKLTVKTLIIALAFLRLCQSLKHIITQQRMIAAETVLSLAVLVCSLVLLLGTYGESLIFLELWMVWSILQFAAMIFDVFNTHFEKDSFFTDSPLLNVAITSSKYLFFSDHALIYEGGRGWDPGLAEN